LYLFVPSANQQTFSELSQIHEKAKKQMWKGAVASLIVAVASAEPFNTDLCKCILGNETGCSIENMCAPRRAHVPSAPLSPSRS
jgi:hypothetical protein